MRIIAGKWRGRALVAPPGEATRPTADRVREALFSMLTSRLGSFEGLRFADVFAGTGALGLEALSRGAAHVGFVESEAAALKALKANIAKCAAEAESDVFAVPAQAVAATRTPYDVLLLDPPYREGLAVPALARLSAQGWIAQHALVSLEMAAGETFEMPEFTIEAVRRHGKAVLHLLRPVPA